MALVLFPQDALEKARALEHEDPLTGEALTKEVVVDSVDLDLSRDPDADEVYLDALSPGAIAGRLGKVPCEALYWMLVARHGIRWWDNEIEVILENLARPGIELDAGGFSKVMALKVLMEGPDLGHPFYSHWMSFSFLSCSLLGRPVRWDEMCRPSSVECALSLLIAMELRPMTLHDQVLWVIAACCLDEGLWCLPLILGKAQAQALDLLAYQDIDIGPEMVEQVRDRVSDLIKRQVSLDDDEKLPDPDEEGISDKEMLLRIQTLRCFETASRISELHHMGQESRDRVFEAVGDRIRKETGS